jgi:hypothetical protein
VCLIAHNTVLLCPQQAFRALSALHLSALRDFFGRKGAPDLFTTMRRDLLRSMTELFGRMQLNSASSAASHSFVGVIPLVCRAWGDFLVKHSHAHEVMRSTRIAPVLERLATTSQFCGDEQSDAFVRLVDGLCGELGGDDDLGAKIANYQRNQQEPSARFEELMSLVEHELRSHGCDERATRILRRKVENTFNPSSSYAHRPDFFANFKSRWTPELPAKSPRIRYRSALHQRPEGTRGQSPAPLYFAPRSGAIAM